MTSGVYNSENGKTDFGNWTAEELRYLAGKGDAEAANELGGRFSEGRGGCEKNKEEAFKWYKASAEKGSAEGAYNLANYYASDRNIQQDLVEAFKWYKVSAEKGHAAAASQLGFYYMLGRGTRRNPAEAFRWFKISAEKGDAGGAYNAALCYDNGDGTQRNYVEAFRWYKVSAEKGIVNGMYQLAGCYKKGKGTRKDVKEAIKWYRKGAEMGDEEAEEEAQKLEAGIEETEEETESQGSRRMYSDMSFDELAELADIGVAAAAYELGLRFSSGYGGCEKNDVEAFKWYKTSAVEGSSKGAYKLAGYYKTGKGTQQDLAEALRWYKWCADWGDEEAEEEAKRLEKEKTANGRG